MKWWHWILAAIVIVAVLVFAFAKFGHAQTTPPPIGQPTPSVSDLDQQLQEVGCKAERQAAAQTIVQLRGQIDTLQAQIKKLDPPKSGATKH